MTVARCIERAGFILVLAGISSHASADQLGARYEQNVVNGEGVLNGAVLNGAWASSFAATFQDELGVMDRPRPEYDAKGIPLGAFRLFPSLQLGAGYTDNVFFSQSNAQADYLYSFAPAATVKSQWAEDSLVFYGGLQRLNYGKFDSQDWTNGEVGASARFVALRSTDVRGNTYYDVLHEPLSSANAPGNAAQPTEFELYHTDAAVDYKPNRFGVTVGGSHDGYTYKATPLIGGGVRDNGDRNEGIDTVYGRASYDFSPGYTGFLGISYDNRNFDVNIDRNGFDRDSKGYQANAGVDILFTHLIRGQLFVGYQVQNYVAPLEDVGTINYGADLNWYATPRLTAHLAATKSIDDTTVAGASASDDQNVSVGVDYELMRELIVQANVGYTDSRFIGISREDRVPGGGLGLRWLINRYMSANASYQFTQRTSDALGQDYSDNQFQFGLRLQL